MTVNTRGYFTITGQLKYAPPTVISKSHPCFSFVSAYPNSRLNKTLRDAKKQFERAINTYCRPLRRTPEMIWYYNEVNYLPNNLHNLSPRPVCRVGVSVQTFRAILAYFVPIRNSSLSDYSSPSHPSQVSKSSSFVVFSNQ